MRVLLDTCILSEIQHEKGNYVVKEVVRGFSDEDIFISVLSIGELLRGINLLEKGCKKNNLLAWIENIEHHYGSRILPVDLETTKLWSQITITAQKAGKIIPAIDGLIASTAIRHGLYVMTRNTKDFKETGALLINPWDNIN